jgi:hypothetical protein
MNVCAICRGERWVCEDHRDTPWYSASGCPKCGGAGAPCPVCNAAPVMPVLPTDFEVDEDAG